MAAYSQDLRERVLRAWERGEPVASIATRLEVSVSWVQSVERRYRETGERTARRVGGYRVSCLAPREEEIRGWIAQTPDLTLEEMVERLADYGIKIHPSSLWDQLDHWGLRFKKKRERSRANPSGRGAGTRRMERRPARIGG